MSVNSSLKAILKSTDKYEKLLDSVTEEQFLQTPANGGWSLSEVYSHIFQANVGSLIAAEKCATGTGKEVLSSTPFFVKLILLFGKFPPGKLKAPEVIASMATKISREDAHNLITKFKKKLTAVSSRIPEASKTQKYKHPRLGYLNASQWIRFIEIHTKHHEKQLKRVAKML